ncbi:hypothetical protein HanRHA438_Chr04g0178571 [Helianthus annuus]|nr:hypothetical protein HanRHA438_Chr04g0178571 [Helianthus annuus]
MDFNIFYSNIYEHSNKMKNLHIMLFFELPIFTKRSILTYELF